mgnify:CR=1 FL=1
MGKLLRENADIMTFDVNEYKKECANDKELLEIKQSELEIYKYEIEEELKAYQKKNNIVEMKIIDINNKAVRICAELESEKNLDIDDYSKLLGNQRKYNDIRYELFRDMEDIRIKTEDLKTVIKKIENDMEELKK